MPPRTRTSTTRRTRLPTTTTRTRLTPAGRTRAAAAAAEEQAHPHRSFFGSIGHAIHHPGISDVVAAVSPPMMAAWAAEHSHIPGLTQAGRASQALFESPIYMAAHPKSSVKNLGTMAKGIVELPTAAYKASGLDPYIQQATHPFARRSRPGGLAPTSFGGVPVRAGGASIDSSVVNALGALWHATKEDYSNRYGKDWKKYAKKEPLFNVADLLMVAGPASKAASMAKAVRALSRMGIEEGDVLAARRAILDRADDPTWKKLNPHEKLKVVRAEVRQPGLMTTGTPRTRRVSVRSGQGEPIFVDQPVSSTPIRRGIQDAGDALAQTFPKLPLAGARSRAIRATSAQIKRATDRLLSSIPGAESLAKLPQAGKERAYWEAQIVKHATDDAGNVIHDHAAVTARLKQLHESLTHEIGHPGWEAKVKADFPELAEGLDMAKQRGFGQNMLKGIERAIKYTPNKHYEATITALKHATVVGENAIRDTEGFTTLNNVRTKLIHQLKVLPDDSPRVAEVNGQIAKVDNLLNTKRSFIEEMLNDSRRKVSDYIDTSYVDAPERHAWEKQMTEMGMTPDEVQAKLAFSDLWARKFRPQDPKGWYADNVGMPTGESAQQVMGRVDKGAAYWQDFPDWGETSLIEGDAMNPAATSAYYSKAQKGLNDAGWSKRGTMQKEQLQAWFQDPKNVSPDEYANANLDLFFDQYPDGAPISRADLNEHLATPLNQYNLREWHHVNLQEAMEDGGYGTQFDHRWEYGDGEVSDQLSRVERPGEYHEIIMVLPEKEIGPWYSGKGGDHWQMNDVAGHIRFQVFEEDGVRKLLVEEIQSDWASDFRKGDTELRPPLNQRRWNRLAVDRILRHAGENEIDQVIFPEADVLHARNAAGDFLDDRARMEAWDSLDLFEKSPQESRPLIQQIVGEGDTSFKHLYEREHPQTAEKRLGVKGKMVDDAYQGHFSPMGGRSAKGSMRGTVFELDDAARARAVEPSALYQRQPEWGKLPRGANELLANGKRQIHLFQRADISTWIHELSHSAIHDLEAADQKILADHYGGGKELAKWTNAAHENYARDFERYMREGDLSFVPRAVADVFTKIQTWMQDTYRALKKADPNAEIPPEVEDVFRRMLTPDADTPDIFMPHRARAANMRGMRMQTGAPRATRAINTEVPAREPWAKRNKLALLRSGMLDADPGHLFEHVNRMVALQKANQIREFLLLHGEPLLNPANVDFENQYVVKAAGTNPNKVLYDALEAAEDPTTIRRTISDFVDDNVIDSRAKLEEAWQGDQQLYVIDKKIADDLFKNVTGKVPGQATKPLGPIGQGADAAMNTLRGLLLYGNPGFYVSNMGGNFGMQMLNDPRSIRYLKDAVTKRGDLYHRVTSEMGRGPTAGGINPEKNILGREVRQIRQDHLPNTAAAAFEWWNHKLNVAGRKAGAVVDDPFRYATWRQEAAKLGYKTDADVRKLLDQGIRDTRKHGFRSTETKALQDLNKIRDRAEQLMLDFDSMTPFERTYLTRLIFLYPFLKASAKYPLMFAGEHPLTAGALLQTSNVGGQLADKVLGSDENLPEWARGYARTPWGRVNIGAVDQASVLAGELQTLMGTGTPTEVGVNRPFNMLHPLVQFAIEAAQSRNRYGRESNLWDIAKSDFPLPSWITATYRDPSQLYTGRSYWDVLLRSLRLYPFQIDEEYGKNG